MDLLTVSNIWGVVSSALSGMFMAELSMRVINRIILRRHRRKLRESLHGSQLLEKIMLNAVNSSDRTEQIFQSLVGLGPFEIHVKHKHDKNVVPKSTLYAACVLKGLEGLIDLGIDDKIIDCIVQNALEASLAKTHSSPKGD